MAKLIALDLGRLFHKSILVSFREDKVFKLLHLRLNFIPNFVSQVRFSPKSSGCSKPVPPLLYRRQA